MEPPGGATDSASAPGKASVPASEFETVGGDDEEGVFVITRFLNMTLPQWNGNLECYNEALKDGLARTLNVSVHDMGPVSVVKGSVIATLFLRTKAREEDIYVDIMTAGTDIFEGPLAGIAFESVVTTKNEEDINKPSNEDEEAMEPSTSNGDEGLDQSAEIMSNEDEEAMEPVTSNEDEEITSNEAGEGPEAEAHQHHHHHHDHHLGEDGVVQTTLVIAALPGAMRLDVASSDGFVIGALVRLFSPGEEAGGGELCTVTGFGSLLLEEPLKMAHAAGSIVRQLYGGSKAALPGGYRMGDMLYYTGASDTLENGYLARGHQGEVIGLANPPDEQTHLMIKFQCPGSTGVIDVDLAELSSERPLASAGEATPTDPDTSTYGQARATELTECPERAFRQLFGRRVNLASSGLYHWTFRPKPGTTTCEVRGELLLNEDPRGSKAAVLGMRFAGRLRGVCGQLFVSGIYNQPGVKECDAAWAWPDLESKSLVTWAAESTQTPKNPTNQISSSSYPMRGSAGIGP